MHKEIFWSLMLLIHQGSTVVCLDYQLPEKYAYELQALLIQDPADTVTYGDHPEKHSLYVIITKTNH